MLKPLNGDLLATCPTGTQILQSSTGIEITPILLCTGDGLDALRRVVLGAMASSLGRRKHTAVWPSLEVMVGPGDGGQEVGGHFDSPLIVVDQLADLCGDPLEEVVDEGVYKEDAHVAAHLGQHNNTIASKINICSPRGCSVNR